MMRRTMICLSLAMLSACATSPDKQTIAELRNVEAPLSEVDVTDSLEKAMEGYRQFLQDTPVNEKTPEAMRRLADLQLEKEFGTVVGNSGRATTGSETETTGNADVLPGPNAVMAPPVAGRKLEPRAQVDSPVGVDLSESQTDFENRASQSTIAARSGSAASESLILPGDETGVASKGPAEAIRTYQSILEKYPHYERNDQVLYQMARAYDEMGRTEEAMEVMDRLIVAYPNSRYRDEVYFRRGEYFFVRRKFLDAEESYKAIIGLGEDSTFQELALYKLGWALYKQDLYEEALHKYIALLDHKLSQGYDFDQKQEEEDDRRVADTFRVISLSFSSLGGAEELNDYFATYGGRSYEDRIYRNLAEFYVTKRRYNDAAQVYESFVELNPLHKVAPHFSMRVAEVYAEGGFPKLVVESKKDFSRRYGLQAEYWQHYDLEAMSDVVDYLKSNLQDLAHHYHALYQEKTQKEFQSDNYAEAQLWYREFLTSFPEDAVAPAINYQLADLHLEHKAFAVAASEYEHTAYDYPAHEQSAAAGYAAIFAHRENLTGIADSGRTTALRATVDSSLRFANTFPEHEHAAKVLGAATDDLFAMKDYEPAIKAGLQLVEQHPGADQGLRRAAWTVVAHSNFELDHYAEAENAYLEVLNLIPDKDESRQPILENLAATIYKQGELANQAQDYALAADHFLRIKRLAPTSAIRPASEYDAAVALVNLKDWNRSAEVLRDFRATHKDNELQPEVTKQLAFVYREAGELGRSADEYRQVAADSDDPELRSESLLLAGDLYRKAGDSESTLSVYRDYVEEFPEPVELNLETRNTIADLLLARPDMAAYHEELKTIVRIDADAGSRRTDRTRYLAAKAALVLAEPVYERFAAMDLVLPFKKSLTEKKKRMDASMKVMEKLVDYEVGEVTAAATFYMAETYRNFSNSLLNSERPKGMDESELLDYNMVIEEEAYPFEERAIEVHQANMELMISGTHNAWVEKSLGELAQLMPGRYAKFETSAGYIGSIDFYAYRSPLQDTLTADAEPIPAEPAVVPVESEGEDADAGSASEPAAEEAEHAALELSHVQ